MHRPFIVQWAFPLATAMKPSDREPRMDRNAQMVQLSHLLSATTNKSYGTAN